MVNSGDEAHRGHERLPGVPLTGEDTASLRREPIESAAALAGFFHPAPLQPAALFEAIQQRIQRRDMEFQLAAGLAFDQPADLVAMPRALLDNRQDDQLRRPLFQLAIQHPPVNSCHSHIWYRQATGETRAMTKLFIRSGALRRDRYAWPAVRERRTRRRRPRRGSE